MTISDPLQARTRSAIQVAPLRRTKIVATLGPSTDGRVDALIAAGMDCARLNCSHGTSDDLIKRSGELRAAAERAGRPVALMFDLQGPKIRLAGDTEARTLQTGEQVLLAAPGRRGEHDPSALTVAYERFCEMLTERSEVVIGDGTPRLRVTGVNGDVATAVVSAPGEVSARKGVNVTHAHTMAQAITAKDELDVSVAAECDADFVAMSFVRCAEDVAHLRELLNRSGSSARIVAKIEKIEAFEHLDSILDAADGIMVARGDYGVEAGIAHVPEMQKETIHKASNRGRVVITATHMLESMIDSPLPTRAEAADVFNAIMDGTSAVMLSAETGVGSYPVEAVRTMAEIAEIAERQEIYSTADPTRTHPGLTRRSCTPRSRWPAMSMRPRYSFQPAPVTRPGSARGTARAGQCTLCATMSGWPANWRSSGGCFQRCSSAQRIQTHCSTGPWR